MSKMSRTCGSIVAANVRHRRSCNVQDNVDRKTDYHGEEKRRKNRMYKGDAANLHRRDRDIRGRIAHGNRKSIIHEIPEVRRLTLGNLEPLLIGKFAAGDGVLVVKTHVVKPKINVRQEPGEDDCEKRG